MLRCGALSLVLLFGISGGLKMRADYRSEYIRMGWQAKHDCAEEAGISVTSFRKLWSLNDYNENFKLKCAIKCLFQRLQIMAKNGKLIDDGLRVFMRMNTRSREMANFLSDSCIKMRIDENPCETAFDLIKCILKNAYMKNNVH